METGKYIRMLDELGRVVLPVDARAAMEWGAKTPIEVCVNTADREIVLKRHKFTCTFCGEMENLVEFQGKRICPACQKLITSL